MSAGNQQEIKQYPPQLPKAAQALKFKNKHILSIVPLINAAGKCICNYYTVSWGNYSMLNSTLPGQITQC